VTETPPDGTLPTGRPTLLTEDMQRRIVQVVKAGNHLKVAAQFNGIGESTLRLWLQRGRKAAALRDRGQEVPEAEERFLSFLEAVTVAQSAAEVAAVTHWRAAFQDDWRAARDYLRYSQPERWSPVTRVQVTPEEAERRIEQATLQVLTAVGVDTDSLGADALLDGDLDPDSDGLDGGPLPFLGADLDDDTWPDGEGDA
jgi:hypothetical protein